MPIGNEYDIVKSVTNHFESEGFLVISKAPKQSMSGTSEFGVMIDEDEGVLRPDVVAARWTSRGSVESIAIECKQSGSVSKSLRHALGQAAMYQTAFDQVYVATETVGAPSRLASVLRDLGIGHFAVDVSRRTPERRVEPTNVSRFFDPVVNLEQVAGRLLMFLGFKDAMNISSKDTRYGLTHSPVRDANGFIEGGYIAKDMGHQVQLNCWYDIQRRQARFGVNVESVGAFRHILSAGNLKALKTRVQDLGDFEVNLKKDPVPGRAGQKDVVILPSVSCTAVNVHQLEQEISNVMGMKGWRPHLGIQKTILEPQQGLPTRDAFVQVIRQESKRLDPVIGILLGRL